MKQTKIDWCDSTINPVVGCKNKCRYCYARKLNARFGFIPNWEEPQFFPERLKQLDSKAPKSIFMDSMSDVDYWERDWVYETMSVISKSRQHKYIFLTKGLSNQYSAGTNGLMALRGSFDLQSVVFIGKTITNSKQYDPCSIYDFLSIEPLLEPIKFYPSSCYLKQVIIGAETGNSVNKVIPKKEWVTDIVKICDEHGIRVFMKESLREIMGEDFRQDKLIWDVKE